MEAKAFPSDYFIVTSQARFHGFDPIDAVIEVQPRAGETYVRTSDIIDTIQTYEDEVAVVLFRYSKHLPRNVLSLDLEKIQLLMFILISFLTVSILHN